MLGRLFGGEQKKNEDDVQQASAVLTYYVHCRKQAGALQRCMDEYGDDGSNRCAAQRDAYTTCSKEHLQQVIDHLCKV